MTTAHALRQAASRANQKSQATHSATRRADEARRRALTTHIINDTPLNIRHIETGLPAGVLCRVEIRRVTDLMEMT